MAERYVVERFVAEDPSRERFVGLAVEYNLYVLREAVIKVLGDKIVAEDSAEDAQGGATIFVFIVSNNDKEAFPVVLIGNETLASHDVTVHGTARPHKLIAPQEILDAVKTAYNLIKANRGNEETTNGD